MSHGKWHWRVAWWVKGSNSELDIQTSLRAWLGIGAQP